MENFNKRKTVLITGAAGDIGREISLMFASKGYNVVLQYLNSEERAEKLLAECLNLGVKATKIKCDLRLEEEVEELFSKAEAEVGNIDILINNAGISLIKLFTDMSFDEWNNVISANLSSCFLTSKRALKYMVHEKSGAIINISSMWGQVGASCETAYSASKGGMIALTKALAQELGPSGITVNCVSPGLIESRMNGELSEEELSAVIDEIPLMRQGTGKDVAEACLYLAEAKFVTGQVIGVNGGMV